MSIGFLWFSVSFKPWLIVLLLMRLPGTGAQHCCRFGLGQQLSLCSANSWLLSPRGQVPREHRVCHPELLLPPLRSCLRSSPGPGAGSCSGRRGHGAEEPVPGEIGQGSVPQCSSGTTVQCWCSYGLEGQQLPHLYHCQHRTAVRNRGGTQQSLWLSIVG